MTVERLSAWMPFTNAAIEDAPLVRAHIEYLMAEPGPLSATERVTGLRPFTSSEGVTINVRVGWRLELSRALQRFVCEAWPEDCAEDDD